MIVHSTVSASAVNNEVLIRPLVTFLLSSLPLSVLVRALATDSSVYTFSKTLFAFTSYTVIRTHYHKASCFDIHSSTVFNLSIKKPQCLVLLARGTLLLVPMEH